jgi:hypothetical protein
MNKNNSIITLINKLPEEIVKKIYIEYVEPDLIYTKLLAIIKSTESQKLNYLQLNGFIKIVLSNGIVTNFLIKNDKIFNQIYVSHIVNNKKLFMNLPDNVSSMCLNWLMYLYH